MFNYFILFLNLNGKCVPLKGSKMENDDASILIKKQATMKD